MKPKEWRTTVELIEELDAEAPKFTHVLLAVGFERTTVFVRAGDPDRLNALNDAVSAGREPVGFIGLKVVTDTPLFAACAAGIRRGGVGGPLPGQSYWRGSRAAAPSDLRQD